MNQLVLALDQGTTSSRAILFDREARIVRSAQQEFPQLLPRPGEVEHDPEAIWETQLGVARQVLAGPGAGAAAVAAWGSPISGRRPSCGNATPAGRWPTRSSGRAASAPASAIG